MLWDLDVFLEVWIHFWKKIGKVKNAPNASGPSPGYVPEYEEFIDFSKTKKESENSWTIDIENMNLENWNLSVNNPNKVEEVDNRTPQEIIAEIDGLNLQANKSLKLIKDLLKCNLQMYF